MFDITYRRLSIEEYPPQGTMDEHSEWMAVRSELFAVMSARYFKRQAKKKP